ncbi:MAG: sigma-70 family RNA polymerase sigma factor [Clostridia bacterium]|nr:sigma-70 family RNA polymerase sigma factor [Clostridia bacterium]
MNDTELFEAVAQGDSDALAALVEENMGLVKSLALRFRDRGTEVEDLVQIGTIGLIKAIRGFDTGFGTRFSTYAVPLISGEIKKHLRDDGIIKVSRELKRKGALLCREKQRLMTETGEEPHISQLAQVSGMTVEEAAYALDAAAPVGSIYESGEGELAPEDTLWTDNVASFSESLALRQAVKSLPAEDRQIVALRYYKGLSQTETARCMGLTQVKISRREKKIMEELRKLLG